MRQLGRADNAFCYWAEGPGDISHQPAAEKKAVPRRAEEEERRTAPVLFFRESHGSCSPGRPEGTRAWFSLARNRSRPLSGVSEHAAISWCDTTFVNAGHEVERSQDRTLSSSWRKPKQAALTVLQSTQYHCWLRNLEKSQQEHSHAPVHVWTSKHLSFTHTIHTHTHKENASLFSGCVLQK